MIFRLHGVFLVYLLVALAWNLLAQRADGQRGRPWERLGVLPLQLLLTAVLVRDRLVPGQQAWSTGGELPWLFPLLAAMALAQNGTAIARRGARLTDIPIVLFNVGVGAALVVAALVTAGVEPGPGCSALLHDHVVLQALLGTHVAPTWPLSWHPPLLLRRGQPRSLLAASAVLLPAATAGFGVVLMAALHGSSRDVVQSFADEPRLVALPAGLRVGVLERREVGSTGGASRAGEAEGESAPRTAPPGSTPTGSPPGDLVAWVVPIDHDGTGLLAEPGRPLVLALTAPDRWQLALPSMESTLGAFADAAVRLCLQLQPDVLLPFPEPDGEAPLFLGARLSPADWQERLASLRARVAAVSPGTRIALRLAGTGAASRELFAALAEIVDIAGPRLVPGGSQRGGAAQVHAVLAAWTSWRDELPEPPELWLLAVGASPLAYGESAQARFLEGCLARAAAEPSVAAVLVEGWRDRGHAHGLLRADGTPRAAGQALARWLADQQRQAGR